MNKKLTVIAAILILFAIILGAFGAHSLKEVLKADQLISFETGVKYQMYTGISLLILGISWDRIGILNNLVIGFILFGILLFSSSIYLLAIQDLLGVKLSFLGPVTPIGGGFLIIGWIIFIFKLLKT